MSSGLAGPVLFLAGVRSMITVTYLSPSLVCRQTCSSTPIVVTPSNRAGSSIRRRLPSARTAAFAALQDTPRPAATRVTVRWSMTMPRGAHSRPPREIFARGAAARVMSCRHVRRQCPHRYRRTRTSRVVGRCPNGSCASRRVTVSRGTPSTPHFRHHGSSSTTRHSIVARSGSISWPTATRPSSSRRQNVVRSGVAKVGWSTSRSFGMASVKNFHHPGDLDPYPATDALNRLHPRS